MPHCKLFLRLVCLLVLLFGVYGNECSFLLLLQYCLAQRGYNYARPGISRGPATVIGNSNVGAIPATAAGSPLRPIVPNLPTGNAATGAGFPTAPTAFGAPSGANVIPTATGFAGFQGNVGMGLSATAPSNSIGSNFGTSGLLNRAGATQRPSGGLFGANAARGQLTQFASGTATGTAGGGDVDYESGGDYSAIPGIFGVDYPVYSQVPQTSFDCAQQSLPGYYSDVEAQCQAFHICALNRTYSFLCPNGTIFSQETLVCVWWNQYDCASAPTLYANNAYLYDYGQEGLPASGSTYQEPGTQLGIGSTTRPQSGFQIAGSSGRTVGTTQRTGVFGSSGGIRPTGSTGFGGIATPITPASATIFAGGNVAGQASTGLVQQAGAAQSFSDVSSGIGSPAIGTIGRGGVGGVGGGGVGVDTTGTIGGRIGVQQNTLQTAQLSTSSTNREYLPPTRRP